MFVCWKSGNKGIGPKTILKIKVKLIMARAAIYQTISSEAGRRKYEAKCFFGLLCNLPATASIRELTRKMASAMSSTHGNSRVARWHIFNPIWVNFGGSCNGRCWYNFIAI
jgi:hypothetical protein